MSKRHPYLHSEQHLLLRALKLILQQVMAYILATSFFILSSNNNDDHMLKSCLLMLGSKTVFAPGKFTLSDKHFHNSGKAPMLHWYYSFLYRCIATTSYA